MGATSFLIPEPSRVSQDCAERAYMANLEQIPWQSRNLLEDDQLTILKDADESGHLVIPWNVAGHGEKMLRTGSLPEQSDPPYILPVELARGMLSSLTNYISSWQIAGNDLSQPAKSVLVSAKKYFADAALGQRVPADAAKSAEESIRLTCDAIRVFSQEVSDRMRGRIERTKPLLATNVGNCVLEENEWKALSDVFNIAMLPIIWRDVEKDEGQIDLAQLEQRISWCRNRGMSVGMGPIIDFEAATTPDWLYLWEDDFDRLSGCVRQFVHNIVQSLHPKVNVWYCHAGLNTAAAVELREEHRLRLTLQTLETLRQIDTKTPVLVSFDQPWGEYLHGQRLELTPLHYADAIIRSEIPINALGLQLNVGYWPKGSPRRDLLQLSQLIERWSLFGLPLMVTLTAPASMEHDAKAGLKVIATPDDDLGCTDASQEQTMREIISLLLLKPAVQIVLWDQFLDTRAHKFPHAGLFDSNGDERPLLKTLRSMRGEFRE